VHLHHYLWGLLILIAVGAFALVDVAARWRQWLGLAFGIGLALVIDEAALLIALRDVYWDDTGTVSVGIALIVIGVCGSVLAFTRSPTAD
jgi:hypothetical protein